MKTFIITVPNSVTDNHVICYVVIVTTPATKLPADKKSCKQRYGVISSSQPPIRDELSIHDRLKEQKET